MSPILSLHQNWLCHALPGFMMIYNDLYYFYCIQLFIYTYIYIFIYLLNYLLYSQYLFIVYVGVASPGWHHQGGITGVASPGWHHLLDLFVLCHPDHQGFRNTTNATATDVECSSQHSCSWWERTAMEGASTGLTHSVFDMFWKIAGWLH